MDNISILYNIIYYIYKYIYYIILSILYKKVLYIKYYKAERTDIIMPNGDKGGTLVIMSTDDYINKANDQLNDKDNYEEQLNDTTLQYKHH